MMTPTRADLLSKYQQYLESGAPYLSWDAWFLKHNDYYRGVK